MSTPAPYHHGNLRAALVDAAVQVVREDGPDGLALRDLARRVGVSHNAAYRHFRDRDAVVAEVGARGMAALSTAMDQGVRAVAETEPVARARGHLHAVGRAYVGFALSEPGLFRVAFASYPDLPGRAAPEDGADPFAQLNAVLDALVDVGYLPAALRPHAEIACWSAVHGFALLCLDGPMRELDPGARDGVLETVLGLVDRSLAVDRVDAGG